jgi:hypothetical protein
MNMGLGSCDLWRETGPQRSENFCRYIVPDAALGKRRLRGTPVSDRQFWSNAVPPLAAVALLGADFYHRPMSGGNFGPDFTMQLIDTARGNARRTSV